MRSLSSISVSCPSSSLGPPGVHFPVICVPFCKFSRALPTMPTSVMFTQLTRSRKREQTKIVNKFQYSNPASGSSGSASLPHLLRHPHIIPINLNERELLQTVGMHPKRIGDGDAFVGVFLIYGFDFFHEQKQGKAAFGVAVDDGDESRVFAKEQAEVIATDTAIGGIAGVVWPGPVVVKAHDVAVVVQGFAEVADGKVDGGFDEFPDGGGAH